jgi:hypothetical protein
MVKNTLPGARLYELVRADIEAAQESRRLGYPTHAERRLDATAAIVSRLRSAYSHAIVHDCMEAIEGARVC